jgi:hypothetical protein
MQHSVEPSTRFLVAGQNLLRCIDWVADMDRVCRYMNEDEPTWVETLRVRCCPPPLTDEERMAYDPPEGSRVEVLFSDEQESWWEGEVKTKKGGFFVIAFPDEGDQVDA